MTTQTSSLDSQTERLEKLERENRNLLARLEKLEKQRSSWLAALLANVILLLAAGVLLDYLGFFPRAVERLPLKAKTVDADEFILRGNNGNPWGKIHVTAQEATLTRYDAGGQRAEDVPLFPKH